jgi:CBS domain-containing protein
MPGKINSNDSDRESLFQNRLAIAVFTISVGGILFAAWLATAGNPTDGVSRREVFSALVPLFGTWVGTILAFYFSRQNFEAANSSLRNVVERLSPTAGTQQLLVRQVMMPLSRMTAITLQSGQTDADVPLERLQDLFEHGFSRIPVLNPDVSPRYVIDENLLNKIAARQKGANSSGTPASTLADLLQCQVDGVSVASTLANFATIDPSASLSDARNAMIAASGALNVLVTQTGQKAAPVVGWLTDTDITRDLRAV